jgi:hypothetical protein
MRWLTNNRLPRIGMRWLTSGWWLTNHLLPRIGSRSLYSTILYCTLLANESALPVCESAARS